MAQKVRVRKHKIRMVANLRRPTEKTKIELRS
jgi:hypothetical protein